VPFEGVFLLLALLGTFKLLLFPGVLDTFPDIEPFKDLLNDLLRDWPKMDWFKKELEVLPLENIKYLYRPPSKM